MLDTVMEVRDETGRLVTEGEGQLFIGIVQLSERVNKLQLKQLNREIFIMANNWFQFDIF